MSLAQSGRAEPRFPLTGANQTWITRYRYSIHAAVFPPSVVGTVLSAQPQNYERERVDQTFRIISYVELC
jgi:hypothetical protein